jgi:hypothetical protein
MKSDKIHRKNCGGGKIHHKGYEHGSSWIRIKRQTVGVEGTVVPVVVVLEAVQIQMEETEMETEMAVGMVVLAGREAEAEEGVEGATMLQKIITTEAGAKSSKTTLPKTHQVSRQIRPPNQRKRCRLLLLLPLS